MVTMIKCNCCYSEIGWYREVYIGSDEYDSVYEELYEDAENRDLCKSCAKELYCKMCDELHEESKIFKEFLEEDSNISEENKDKISDYYEEWMDKKVCPSCYKDSVTDFFAENS